MLDRGRPDDVEAEGRLSHRRPGGDDDHLAGVQAVGQGVEVGEAGGHAGHLAGPARGDLDLVDRGLDDVADGVVVLAAALVGDGVDLGLGGVDDVLDVAAALGVAELDDAGAGLDEPAQHGALGDDLGVVAGVGRGGHRGDELVEVGLAADAAEVAALGQLVADGDGVGRLAAAVEVEDRVVDQLVRGTVEVGALELLDAVGDGVLGQEHAAEHGLLGADVLRREPVVRRATVTGRRRREGARAQLGERHGLPFP